MRTHKTIPLPTLILVSILTGWGCGRFTASAPSVGEAPQEQLQTVESQHSDATPAYASPWLNVQPAVQYVGDDACASCHVEHSKSFQHHSMGRSLAPTAAASSIEGWGTEQRNPFSARGVEYRVEKRGGKTFHVETLRNDMGKLLARIEREANFAVGSGVSGRSYLFERDGFLLMSSLTWYPRQQIWDLSPGYSVRNHHFSRPVTAECLFCHCNSVSKVPDTLNRYVPPIFNGFSIGCERCHGPGSLHVRARQESRVFEKIDRTIVNPRHLEPELREAVCQQCHLQGQHRVARRGKDTFDFRPGLPLQDFITVFLRHPNLVTNDKFVGQVEQMYGSKCFQGSGGRMGCTTCHDPHVLLPAGQRAAWHRQRCLNCHENHGCSLPVNERLRQSKDDSCIQCHMPVDEANITHTAFSDHRIRRRPDTKITEVPRRLPQGELPLVPFRRPDRMADRSEMERDLGIALMLMAENHEETLQRSLAQEAVALLKADRAESMLDLPAWEARANALWTLGRHEEAADAFAKLLGKSPRLESALSSAAGLATEMGRYRAARRYWESVIAINPYRWRYRLGLATVHARQQDWHSALYQCQQGIQLHPFAKELRQLAVTCQLALGNPDLAREELEVLLALEPGEAERHRAWFAELLRDR